MKENGTGAEVKKLEKRNLLTFSGVRGGGEMSLVWRINQARTAN